MDSDLKRRLKHIASEMDRIKLNPLVSILRRPKSSTKAIRKRWLGWSGVD
jgi:predicted transcriptional regulator